MKTVVIKYNVGECVVDGLHEGTILHTQWISAGNTYYMVEYTQPNTNGKFTPIYWEYSEEEIDKAILVANNDRR